jgi:hypothetical protein
LATDLVLAKSKVANGPANYCHSQNWRRVPGSAFNIGLRVKRKDLKVTATCELKVTVEPFWLISEPRFPGVAGYRCSNGDDEGHLP